MTLAVAVTAAIVVQDHIALRASADRTAAQQAVLWKGDWLEVRGERAGWVKVYDHRHERAGWIAAKSVKRVELAEASAPAARAVVEFLRDTPGQESLGIAYAGIYLKVAPKAAIDASIMISLGAMADRLAHRASSAGGDAASAEQLEVARSWGIVMTSVDQLSGAHICYDGAAFEAGLALAPGPTDAATAVLGLSDPGCEPAGLGLTERQARAGARLKLLETVDPTAVGGPVGDRLRIRRAELGAELAWAEAQRGDPTSAHARAEAAVAAFARVDKAELAEDDESAYAAAAVAIGAARWAALPTLEVAGLTLALAPGDAGETCATLTVKGSAPSAPKCSHGQIWASSLRANKDHSVVALAVEPLPGWLELWMFRRGADGGWSMDVLAPDTNGPDRGYVELAGWSPDGAHALIVREARAEGGAIRKQYQSITVGTLAVDHETSTLAGQGAAKQWAAAEWRRRTIALR